MVIHAWTRICEQIQQYISRHMLSSARLGLKKLLFPETRPTLAFTPDPKNFMDLFVLNFFRVQFQPDND